MGFAGARERQQAAIFARLGEDAIFDGGAEPVRVRHLDEDEVAGFGDGSNLIVPRESVRVRRIDVAAPSIGKIFELIESGRRFRITSDPIRNRNDVWVCPVSEVTV